MREIKFRAWDTYFEDFANDTTLEFDDGEGTEGVFEFVDEAEWNDLDSSRYTIMQFTGLKDKNGVEIYEGDIVRTEFGVINKISWFRSGWIFNNPITNPNALVNFSDNEGIESKMEVIGNIYENPELLTN